MDPSSVGSGTGMNKTLTGALVGSAMLAAGCGAVPDRVAHQAAHQAAQAPAAPAQAAPAQAAPAQAGPSAAASAPAALTPAPGQAAPAQAVPASPAMTTPGSSPASTPTGGSPAPTGGRVGSADLRRAAKAALAAVPGSTLISIESELSGRLWEVHVVDRDGVEHQMDVESGAVVRGPARESGDAEDRAELQELVRASRLGYAQAADRIAATVPEGWISELNLDRERGKAVWEADVVTPDGTKHSVTIDAMTGTATRSGRTS
ncbi:MAG TPA: PepSY domain-containing protein [Nonomuraea sp.]|nr:PepSY domain-containing protein [Nonomuraea sp.]